MTSAAQGMFANSIVPTPLDFSLDLDQLCNSSEQSCKQLKRFLLEQVVLTTDNGGATNSGKYLDAGNNWPLR